MEIYHQTFTANTDKLINIKGDKFWDGQAQQGMHVFRLNNKVEVLKSRCRLLNVPPPSRYLRLQWWKGSILWPYLISSMKMMTVQAS